MSPLLLSTECVNDWCDECRYTDCGCDCHTTGAPAALVPRRPRPMSASSERVYAALVEFHRANGYAPSTRELCDAVGLAAGTINYHVHRLEAAGRVRFAHGRARTVTPVRRPQPAPTTP